MMTALLVIAPLMLATPEAVSPAPVNLGPPSILTGRKRGYAATEWEKIDTAVASGQPVAMQCKEFAPPMFSGRAKRDDCELEIVPPQTVAPAIFSGRPPKRGEVIIGTQAVKYYPPGAVGKNETEAQEIAEQAAEQAASGVVYMPAAAAPPKPKRRAPSIFSGRRARPAPAQ